MDEDINNSVKDEHIKEVYSDKAINLLNICKVLLIINGLTYVLAFLVESFDFGLIFEIVSFVFILLAISAIKQKNIYIAKRNVVISVVPIICLIIYDLIQLMLNFEEVLGEVMNYYTSSDQYFYYITPYLVDVSLIAIIFLLYKTFSSLSKADGSKKENNYVEDFYDKL